MGYLCLVLLRILNRVLWNEGIEVFVVVTGFHSVMNYCLGSSEMGNDCLHSR